MYKASIRAVLRHGIRRLNEGDHSLLRRLAHPDIELAFPGEHSWSTMFRPQVLGRERHVTHRGLDEVTAFADRFVAEGIQFAIEDIVICGPPWNTRVVVRVQDWIVGPDGGADTYDNRAILFQEIRWGRIVRWETYEDTQRVAAWDAAGAA